MLISKSTGDTEVRALSCGVSRIGTLCGVLGMMLFLTGCNPCQTQPCNDGEFCNGNETCTVDSEAEAGYVCGDGEDVVCDAGFVCDEEQDACVEQTCELLFCDDGNPCTDDSCDEETVTCVNAPNTADCDDGSDCTEADVCGGGVCAGTAVVCDDGDACTTEVCVVNAEGVGGCVFTNVVCPEGEDCIDGACVQTCTADTDCPDDGDVCTTETCINGGCIGVNNSAACDDGNVCTDNDTCADGACAGSDIAGCCTSDADCTSPQTCDTATNTCVDQCVTDTDCADDGDACTDETCDNGSCVSSFNTAGCDDGDLCTNGDACDGAGGCAGTPVNCPADQECNPANGNCEAIVCQTSADCDDGFSCTTDTCDVGTGACVHTEIHEACNDGLFCTGTETCAPADEDADANGCVATGDPCPPKICNDGTDACDDCTDDAECNDGVHCTDDTCDLVFGDCVNANNDLECPDPDFCDGVDFCDPAHADADGDGCVQTPGAECDPRLCNETTNECFDCTSNAECDDGITCTLDVCNDPTPGDCAHTDIDADCPNNKFCDGPDICISADPDADADGCIPTGGTCPNACDENADACFDCTSNGDCDDGIACTDDVCNIPALGDCDHQDNCTFPEACNVISGACE